MAVIVFMVVGVGKIVRCRYAHRRDRSRQKTPSGCIHQTRLPPLL